MRSLQFQRAHHLAIAVKTTRSALLLLSLCLAQNARAGQAAASVALSATRNADSTVTLLWPVSASNMVLESTASLAAPARWSPVVRSAITSGSSRALILEANKAPQFFRLHDLALDVPLPPTASSGQATIRASDGGEIVVPGSDVVLSVPPGALTQDTTITLTNFVYGGPFDDGVFNDVILSPSGLKLEKPATLKVKLPVASSTAPNVAVWSLSEANPPQDLGSEISYFQKSQTPFSTRKPACSRCLFTISPL